METVKIILFIYILLITTPLLLIKKWDFYIEKSTSAAETIKTIFCILMLWPLMLRGYLQNKYTKQN